MIIDFVVPLTLAETFWLDGHPAAFGVAFNFTVAVAGAKPPPLNELSDAVVPAVCVKQEDESTPDPSSIIVGADDNY